MQNQLLFDTEMKTARFGQLNRTLGLVQTTPHGCAEDFVNHGNTLSQGEWLDTVQNNESYCHLTFIY